MYLYLMTAPQNALPTPLPGSLQSVACRSEQVSLPQHQPPSSGLARSLLPLTQYSVCFSSPLGTHDATPTSASTPRLPAHYPTISTWPNSWHSADNKIQDTDGPRTLQGEGSQKHSEPTAWVCEGAAAAGTMETTDHTPVHPASRAP